MGERNRRIGIGLCGLFASAVVLTASIAHGSVIFQQTFSDGLPLSQYAHATDPDRDQFTYLQANSPSTMTVSNGRLVIDKKNQSNWMIVREVDFDVVAEQLLFSFDFRLKWAAQTNGTINFGLGENYHATGLQNGSGNNAVFFHLRSTSATQFALQPNSGTNQNSANFAHDVDYTLRWYINQSATESMTFNGPDGNPYTIATNRYDIWLNDVRAVAEFPAYNAALGIKQLKVSTSSGTSANPIAYVLNMDNIELTVIPEPSSVVVLAGASVVALRRGRHRAMRR